MADACSIDRGAQGELRLGGALTFGSVAGAFEKLKKAFNEGDGPSRIDLGDVRSADSAGLALLLELQALQSRRGGRIEFRNAPDMLLSLARLCEADEVLDIRGGRPGP